MPNNSPMFDLINIVPIQSFDIKHTHAVASNELYDLWKNYSKDDGSIEFRKVCKKFNIDNLISLGFLKKYKTANVLSEVLEITEQGKKIIRNFILKDRNSTFEINNIFNALSKSASNRNINKIKYTNWLIRCL